MYKRFVASVLTVAASSAFLFASKFDAKTGLSAEWQKERPKVEARIRDYHTDSNTGVFNQTGYDTNVTAIERFIRCVVTPSQCK